MKMTMVICLAGKSYGGFKDDDDKNEKLRENNGGN